MINCVYSDGGGERRIEFDPKRLKYDGHGVPIITAPEIEAVAMEVLQTHCPRVLVSPRPTPVAEILDNLQHRTGLMSLVADNLGYKGNAKVIGRVSFRKRILFLDESLIHEKKAAFRFTVAHEIGHWVLHRYNYRNWSFDLTDSSNHNPTPQVYTVSPRGRLESQAKSFAASLVMPRQTFVQAVQQVFTDLGIEVEDDARFLDCVPCSQQESAVLVRHLCRMFDVSMASTRIRLKTLRLL